MPETPHTPPPAAVMADRSAGVVVASAAGDALGAGYEFGPPLPPAAPVRPDGGGAFGWEPGEWTDDTQLAVAVLTALADPDSAPEPLAAIEAGFRTWYASGPADVGNQTRAVLRSTGPLAEAAARFTADHPDGAAGNGSLMRTGPVALANPDDPAAVAELARAVSALTHADPDCVDACVLWSLAIDHTIHHAPPSDRAWDWEAAVAHGLDHLPADRRARWQARIDDAAGGVPLDFPRNGWVVHAFQAALAAICSTPVPDGDRPADHLRLALEHAVRAGGDTDTVAAIAGSLLGARWGATALPFAWRRRLHGRRTYHEPALTAADLERLARLAARSGRPDTHGWPGIPSMLPHYDRRWRDDPRRVTLGGVQFGNVHALADALADGVDTVISLCRMGTDDVPAAVEHHVLGLLDTTAADNPNLVFLLDDLVHGVGELVDEGRHVFVHCVQARNRTPTVAAAWLGHRESQPATEALDRAAAALRRPEPFLAEAVTRVVG